MQGELIEIEQGTDEWLELRRNRLGASEVAAALGVSKFHPKTLRELVEMKKTGAKVFVNKAMQRGNECEARARELANEALGDVFVPQVFVSDIFVASLDGLNFDFDIAIEIKVSKKPLSELCEQYKYQIQQQILVSGIRGVYLVAYREETDSIEISELFGKDEQLQAQILQAGKDFKAAMENYTPTESDPLALEYVVLSEEIGELESKLKEIKEKLIASHKDGYKDNYITISKTKGRTTTDYKRAFDDLMPSADLSAYQKTTADTYSFRIAKEK